ncbi:MAG: ferredoxin [Oscillospiraceae bacterium]|jgi:NADP-reducing hydrogenase subunit HndB
MKSLQELAAIRDRMKQTVNAREEAHGSTRVVVGMATCGIAAGARPVLNAFTEEVARRELDDILVTQTGCIGICQFEPVVEVYRPGEEKVTYVKMTPERAQRVVTEHLMGGKPVTEFTIGAAAR